MPAPAHADGDIFGGGLFLGYRFGERGGFEWGVEAFATRRFSGTGCSEDRRYGAGPLLQVSMLGLAEPRVTLALQGGGELSRIAAALTAELGVTYRFREDGGFGFHLGVVPETFYVNAAFRYQALLDEAWLGAGVRVLPTYGDPRVCASIAGRPYRTDAGVAPIGAAARSDREALSDASDRRARVELAGLAFERDAQLEYASVPAFVQLAAELMLLGAPATLVQRALGAAQDELLHARLCAALAARHLAQGVTPTLPDVVQRRALAGEAGLLRLAVESWFDGCLVEGVAAAQAARAAELASDPDARALEHRIAVDEQRHAELAWAILKWVLERSGDVARDALRACSQREVPEVPRTALPDDLQPYGRLAPAELDAVARRHATASRARLDRLLARRSGSRAHVLDDHA